MSDRKALRILKETLTEHGYCIRQEYWENSLSGAIIEIAADPDGAGDALVETLQNSIDDAPDETLMTTAYTDDGYWIGDVDTAKYLCVERGISPRPHEGVERGQLRPCNHGWCEKEQKWYGWSHRAIFGFGVGSEVKRGSCAYVPTNMEDARLEAIRFWSDDRRHNVIATLAEDEDGETCFEVSWTNTSDPNLIKNEAIRGRKDGSIYYPPRIFGKGEWIASTLDDAKQMALDFAEGVS